VVYLYLDRFDRKIAKAIGEDEPELGPVSADEKDKRPVAAE